MNKNDKNWLQPAVIFLSFILFFLAPAAQAAVLSKAPNNLGLVGYWPLNESQGYTAGDFSGTGHNGTLVGAPTWVSGKHGNALNFDSSSKYVTTSGNSGLSGDITITMSAWIYPTNNTQNFQMIVNQSAADIAGKCAILVLRNGRLSLDFCSGGWTQSATLATNQWYHVVGVKTPGLMSSTTKLYVNGVDVTSGGSFLGGSDATPNVTNSTFTLGIFGASLSQYNFNGKIDDVRIYNRALSASDVSALYRSGQATAKIVSARGLVGQWAFDEGRGSQAGDSSQSRNTGTLSGNPAPAWISGKHNKGLSFSGTVGCSNPCTNYGLVTTSSFSLPTTLTVCAWIYPNQNEVKEIIIHGSAAPPTAFELYQNGLSVSLRGGSNTVVSSSNSLTLNSWNFVCGTINSTTGIVYINGVGSTPATVTAPNSSSASLNIGAYNNNNYAFNGFIDDVRVYNRTLTAAEILALYKNGAVQAAVSQNSRLTNGLVGMWSFNGPDYNSASTTAEVLDRSGSGNNGDNIGATRVGGKVGQGLSFDGSASKVVLGTTGLPSGSSDRTVSAWIYHTANSDWQMIFNYGTASTNNGFGFGFGGGANNAKLIVGRYGANSTESTSAINLNEWAHVSVVYSGGSVTFYINGLASGSYSFPSVNTTLTYARIGKSIPNWDSADGTYVFNGKIDEVRIYNRALSASEVYQLYNMGR